MFSCGDKRCECCSYLLIYDHYTFKNVQITFKIKTRFTCDSFNFICIVLCDTYKEEYIGETREGKTKPTDRVGKYRQHIRQPQYQQLKVEGQFRIFLLLRMRSQDYDTWFQQKFKARKIMS